MGKRYISLILAVLVILSLSACSLSVKTDKTPEKDIVEDSTSPDLSITGSDAKYEQRRFSNAMFLSRYEEVYRQMKEDEYGSKYGPSDVYLRYIDGNLIDTYADDLNRFFLTKNGLFEMQWDLTCTYKIPVEFDNAQELICANFSFALIKKEDGSLIAYEFKRDEAQNYKVVSVEELRVEGNIQEDVSVKEFDMDMLYVVGVTDSCVQTMSIRNRYDGTLVIIEDSIPFKRELTFSPVDYYVVDDGVLVIYLIDEKGNYYRCESVENSDSYSKVLITPYEPIKGIDNVIASSTNQLIVTKNNGRSLYVYEFENWNSYDMYEFPISISNFNESDIGFCIGAISGYGSSTFVMNDGKVYRIDINRLCYDNTHDHSNVKDFERYHGQDLDNYVSRYEYTKDGKFDGLFTVNKFQYSSLESIVTEDNVLYFDSAFPCLMMTDGYAYVFEEGT